MYRRMMMMMAATGACAVALWAGVAAQKASAGPLIEVYKTPTCGCCAKWVDHVRASGFTVRVTELADLSAVKKARGVPDNLQSCHTSVVSGYVVEGHVPAEDVHRLLKEKPPIVGIAVPGMPVGSPGMEYPGTRAERYAVYAFDKSGGTPKVFAKH